jgi:hypothetical protein
MKDTCGSWSPSGHEEFAESKDLSSSMPAMRFQATMVVDGYRSSFLPASKLIAQSLPKRVDNGLVPANI